MAYNFDTTSNYFSDSISNSGKSALADSFVKASGGEIGGNFFTQAQAASDLSGITDLAFGPNAPDFASILGLDSSKFLGGLAGDGNSWTFITAPGEVSWNIVNQANRVDIFGTNSPPVVAGSRGMRDLSLSNALVEGFVRKVSLEGKIASLENLLNYSLNSSDGFVSVPVYQVWANSKSYGGSNAFFIIKDVRVNESMRDLKGNTTRAKVDISLMQVPSYQVNSGRDQASQVTSAAGAAIKQAANQEIAGTANNGGAKPGAAGTKPAGGSGTPKPTNLSTGFKAKAIPSLGDFPVKTIPTITQTRPAPPNRRPGRRGPGPTTP